MKIRIATIKDAENIRNIYAPYVLNTAVSFEYELPDIKEFTNRIESTLKNYPYLVAMVNDDVVGYAYASAFHSRAAYRHSAELSVYVRENCKKSGIGSALYESMEAFLINQNIYIVHACIASADKNDEYLTDDSEKFHTKMGFSLAGRHKQCGYKFGKWYDIIWMDKVIQDIPDIPEDFIPFSQLNSAFINIPK